ncbi:UDPGP family [Dillenia turbinata]|uniref:UDPGP family n=1 Tax=Dillenia turbinata TaxID=194707 RepID=A0AAN8ZBC1_9MAGN
MREPTAMVEGNTIAAATAPAPPQALLERLKDYGQEDAFALWDELSLEERDLLVHDIESLDLPRIDRIIRRSLGSQGLSVATIEPVPESRVSKFEDRTPEERERLWKIGLKAISEGRLAVLLLSGGQGTRLGSSDPKGCFNIGLPSGKSLFQLQAERILCIQRLAAQAVNEGSAGFVQIHWYIMTSPFTNEATSKYFESHKYFGLEADQVTFFQQGTIPCVSKDGRFIMETPYRVAKSPDGNGGVYAALKYSKLLEDMAMRGIRYIDCYGVDNALVRVADPCFLGYFIDKGVAAAAKVVRKAYPQEKVGVFVRRGKGGPLSVVEYSELDPSLASAINQETGLANGLEKDSIYHIAEKKIPSIHGYTMGFKLEQFIFDAFAYAPSTVLFEVLREEEFAPVKNANGSNYCLFSGSIHVGLLQLVVF